MSIDLKDLENTLDKALEKETKESIKKFVNDNDFTSADKYYNENVGHCFDNLTEYEIQHILDLMIGFAKYKCKEFLN
jgi:poly-D-alanine transfer protein DltD